MSARDDLVAAMEAHEAWFSSDNEGDEEWDECVLAAFKLIRKHGKHLLALLDAEPVAWQPVIEDVSPEGDHNGPSVLALYHGSGGMVIVPAVSVRCMPHKYSHWMPLPAPPPEASDE